MEDIKFERPDVDQPGGDSRNMDYFPPSGFRPGWKIHNLYKDSGREAAYCSVT